jgi:hypothetical protein
MRRGWRTPYAARSRHATTTVAPLCRATTMGFWKTATTHHRRKEDSLPSNHGEDHDAAAKNSNGDKAGRPYGQRQQQQWRRGLLCGALSAMTRWRCWILACGLLVFCCLVGTPRLLPSSSSRLLQLLQLPFWPWSTTKENVPPPCFNTTTTVQVPVERIVYVDRNVTQIVYDSTSKQQPKQQPPTQRACREVFRSKVRRAKAEHSFLAGMACCARVTCFPLGAHHIHGSLSLTKRASSPPPLVFFAQTNRAKAVQSAWITLRYNDSAIIR